MLKCFCIDGLNVFHSVYKYLDSNMYVVIEGNEALIVDPHKAEYLQSLLSERSIKKILVLLSHEHHDHTSGISWLREHFETTLFCQRKCAEWISSRHYLRPMLISFILGEADKQNYTNHLKEFQSEYQQCIYIADAVYDEEYSMMWKNHSLECYHIQGHSCGGSLILLDHNVAFTGDSLMKENPVIVRFPGGNKQEYLERTLPLINEKLDDNIMVLPGHGVPFRLYEIKKEGKIDVQFR